MKGIKHKKSSAKDAVGQAGTVVVTTRSRRFRLAILAVIVVVVVGLFGVGPHIKRNIDMRNRQQALVRIHKQILTDSVKYLDAKYVAKLEPLTQQIKQQPNYQSDPSYVYILLKYYINLSDSVNARAYLNNLSKYHPSDETYDPILSPYTLSLEDLKQTVVFLENQNHDIRQNVTGMGRI